MSVLQRFGFRIAVMRQFLADSKPNVPSKECTNNDTQPVSKKAKFDSKPLKVGMTYALR